jgi:hypothetical protein
LVTDFNEKSILVEKRYRLFVYLIIQFRNKASKHGFYEAINSLYTKITWYSQGLVIAIKVGPK